MSAKACAVVHGFLAVVACLASVICMVKEAHGAALLNAVVAAFNALSAIGYSAQEHKRP